MITFQGNELNELLERSIENLNGKDFILSDALRMEDAMMALDLENPRMDRALLTIKNVPLFQFQPPPLSNIPSKQFMTYSLRCLFSWLRGDVNLAESLLTITAFHYNNTKDSNDKLIYYFVLGVWRIVDLVNDLIAACEVVKREEFYYCALYSRIPKEAGRSRNGLIISHLQELEAEDPTRLLRLLKFLIMLFTGIQLGQPISVLRETIILPLKEILSSSLLLETSDTKDDKTDLIGAVPLLCNLVSVGCPKTNIKPPLNFNESILFLHELLDHDLQEHRVTLAWLLSFPFKTVIGRAVFALYQQRALCRRGYLFFGGDQSSEAYLDDWRIVGLLLHSPARQWRLLCKYIEEHDATKDKMLMDHWAMIGRQLRLFEPDELILIDIDNNLALFSKFLARRGLCR